MIRTYPKLASYKLELEILGQLLELGSIKYCILDDNSLVDSMFIKVKI